jgi:GNAT superfamily N-acetyltransferase
MSGLVFVATAEWLAAMSALQHNTPEQAQNYRRILGQLVIPVAFALLSASGQPVSLAHGVIHRGLLSYESVISDHRRLRRGYGSRIVAAFAAWAKENGADGAYLQVEAGNFPARALYDAIGLSGSCFAIIIVVNRYHLLGVGEVASWPYWRELSAAAAPSPTPRGTSDPDWPVSPNPGIDQNGQSYGASGFQDVARNLSSVHIAIAAPQLRTICCSLRSTFYSDTVSNFRRIFKRGYTLEAFNGATNGFPNRALPGL